MPDVLGTRTAVSYYSEAYSVAASEALVPVTGVSRQFAAATTGQLTVTAAKTLRIETITATGVVLGSRGAASTVRLLAAAGGAATVSSPIATSFRLGIDSVGTQAANYGLQPVVITFPEGLEVPAGSGLQFTAISTTAAMHSLTLVLHGFEY